MKLLASIALIAMAALLGPIARGDADHSTVVIESMAPPLPDGTPAAAMAHGIVWAATALAAPHVAMRAVIQCADRSSAQEVLPSVRSLAGWFSQRPPQDISAGAVRCAN